MPHAFPQTHSAFYPHRTNICLSRQTITVHRFCIVSYAAILSVATLREGEDLGVSEKKFCRTLVTNAFWTASISVSLIGLDTEASLRKHCLLYFPEATCYTRSSTTWTLAFYNVSGFIHEVHLFLLPSNLVPKALSAPPNLQEKRSGSEVVLPSTVTRRSRIVMKQKFS